MQACRIPTSKRRGNAAVELAITLPIIATVIFGSIEVCGLAYNKQAIVSAAYECANVAILAEGTDAQVQARMSSILTQRGITGGTVTTTPASIEGIPRGTQITVLVSAPVLGNSLIPIPAYGPANIQASCMMLKEPRSTMPIPTRLT